ncbi:predicted protein [Arabidopsis lyrata subsp. lyrata]|uniref:Predicted protein n=1 Tax=Arabidopsis lyrata subsp. lyrata TaxID=81972 RepID=D7LGF9_ARALL|nr:predicted protein [Arabidopsis lyrata subsp. lyrata]
MAKPLKIVVKPPQPQRQREFHTSPPPERKEAHHCLPFSEKSATIETTIVRPF